MDRIPAIARMTDLGDARQVDGFCVSVTDLMTTLHPPVLHQVGGRDALIRVLRQTCHHHFLRNPIDFKLSE